MTAKNDITRSPPIALSLEHFSAVKVALSNILASDLALDIYAQIANGVPVPTSWDKEMGGTWWLKEIPDPEPSEEAYHIAKMFRSNFNIQDIEIHAKIAQQFQNETVGSTEFFLGLIEFFAVLCHDIAAFLFNLTDGGLRKPVLARPDGIISIAKSTYSPYFTLLSHKCYHEHQGYPLGSADVVGYWAEDRLFGGVVLFGRGHSGAKYNSVFLNPAAGLHIFQLSEAQLQNFLRFLTHKSQSKPIVDMPYRAEEDTPLINPKDSLVKQVYREEYDCKTCEYDQRPRCVRRVTSIEMEWLQSEYERLIDESRRR